MKTPLQVIQSETVEALLKQTSKKGMEKVWNAALTQIASIKGNKTGIEPSEAEISNRVNAIRKSLKDRLKPEKFKSHKFKSKVLLGEKKYPNFVVRASEKTMNVKLAKSIENTKSEVEMGKTARNYSEVIKWAETTCKESFDWKELAISLLILTGRRTTEIIKTGKFKHSKTNPEIAMFSGQLKDRSNTKGAYTMPVLTDAKTIVKGLKRLRKIYPTNSLTNNEVNSKVARALNDRVEKLRIEFDVCSCNLKVHDLRKIYARYCYEFILGKDNQFPKNSRLFMEQILGHGGTSVGLTYEAWRLKM